MKYSTRSIKNISTLITASVMATMANFSIGLPALGCQHWAASIGLPALADNPGTGQTTEGQTLNILIDESVRDVITEPGQAFTLNGTTGIGALAGQANVLYAVDVSSSTSGPRGQDCDGNGVVDADDNFNGDSTDGDTLDCEISGVLALNESLAANTSVSAGLVLFGSRAAIADVDPSDGDQNFISPLNVDHNGNSVADMAEVTRSLSRGSASLFTIRGVGTSTSFDNAIQSINQAFASANPGTNIAFFLSDGESRVNTRDNGPLVEARAAGTIINTYSIGSGATGCAEGQSLRTIADETGGTCIEVADPTQLRVVLPGTPPADIERVDVVAGASGVLPASLDALGKWSVDVPEGVYLFPLMITATVYATDGTAVIADILIDPPGATSLETTDEPRSQVDSPSPADQEALSEKIFIPLLR